LLRNFFFWHVWAIIIFRFLSNFLRGLIHIKTKSAFSAIREINEILSLTNEPLKLANTALDTLAQVLKVDCCWIQTISDRKNKELRLAAARGFTDEIRREINTMDLDHDFSEQIIGLGHKVVIPDLHNDGLYGLSSFRQAGYRWLVAVPIMTYRVHGILGTASHNKKGLQKETADLIMVIAGLIGNSLSKAYLERTFPAAKKAEPPAAAKPEKKEPPPVEKAPENKETGDKKKPDIKPVTTALMIPSAAPQVKNPPKKSEPVIPGHNGKRKTYRELHPRKTAS
jgi:hypothetical protein